MWLSRAVYESLPYYYLGGGAAIVVLGLLIDSARWGDTCFAVGLVALVAGAVLLLRRRAYRTSRSP